MALELYFMLGTKSRRAITKQTGKFGRNYNYRPRGDLLERLSDQTGKSKEEIYNQLQRERQELLTQKGVKA